jgi:hypothetical protein
LGPAKISERRACRVLDQPRGTQRYQSRRPADEPPNLKQKNPPWQNPRFRRVLRGFVPALPLGNKKGEPPGA